MITVPCLLTSQFMYQRNLWPSERLASRSTHLTPQILDGRSELPDNFSLPVRDVEDQLRREKPKQDPLRFPPCVQPHLPEPSMFLPWLRRLDVEMQ